MMEITIRLNMPVSQYQAEAIAAGGVEYAKAAYDKLEDLKVEAAVERNLRIVRQWTHANETDRIHVLVRNEAGVERHLILQPGHPNWETQSKIVAQHASV